MLAPYIIITRNENGEEREYTELFLMSIPRSEKIELAKAMYEVDGFKIVNHSF
jgi:hypothetical protein